MKKDVLLQIDITKEFFVENDFDDDNNIKPKFKKSLLCYFLIFKILIFSSLALVSTAITILVRYWSDLNDERKILLFIFVVFYTVTGVITVYRFEESKNSFLIGVLLEACKISFFVGSIYFVTTDIATQTLDSIIALAILLVLYAIALIFITAYIDRKDLLKFMSLRNLARFSRITSTKEKK